ncbi:hypothetical protein AYO39_00190 [Actinobacteria bacterium SCGC AG-212-D09]|nr:hypothetical protein AYO39_00190 [Actinobacteria bacterium SCGC AG-212-D09]
MLDLLEAGKLRAGVIVHANHHGHRHEATVTKDGKLKAGPSGTGVSPTTAARRITGRPINGWVFWLVEQDQGHPRSLWRLRKELVAEREHRRPGASVPTGNSRPTS